MPRPLDVAFLTLYPVETASTRQRIYKNARWFPGHVRYAVYPGIDSRSVRRLAARPGRWARARALAEEVGRKLVHLWRARRADVIVVQKGLTAMNLRGLPWLLFLAGKPVVFDFDDAVHLGPPQSPRSRLLRRLTDPRQVLELIRRSTVVVAGNRHLAAVAAALNPSVRVIATPMDTDLYRPRPVRRHGRVVVGWSGSSATNHYVARLGPVLAGVAARGLDVEFRVISNDDRGIPWERFAGVPVRFVPWTLERLAEDLAELDVGLMPLTDDEWSRSKCGGKLLQYMACGIPAVASPVGINRDVIADGVTGFLAGDDPEWVDRIARLAADPDLRERIGTAARREVERSFQNRVTAPQLLRALEDAAAARAPLAGAVRAAGLGE